MDGRWGTVVHILFITLNPVETTHHQTAADVTLFRLVSIRERLTDAIVKSRLQTWVFLENQKQNVWYTTLQDRLVSLS